MPIQLSGPYTFNPQTVDQKIAHTYPGVYALGYTSILGHFVTERVGRSDSDLNARLKSDEYKGKYSQFMAAYVLTADEAYHAECELYHVHGGPNNPNHPAVPWGKTLKCKHCKHPWY